MDQVVPAGLVVRLGAQHRRRESAHLCRKVALAQPFERAGRHVPDQHARVHLDSGRLIAGRRAGEYLDLGAGVRHALGGLDDVDVHPACVATARSFERRGVDAQHRDTLH
jgi:hypothetical protein